MTIYAMQNASLFQMQKQQQLAQQQEKYNNSIADYNLQKVVKYYTQAINSADNSGDAQKLAADLNSILQTYGQSIDDYSSEISNNALNGETTAATKKSGSHYHGNAEDKAIIKDISDEFGIDVKKAGTTKDWLALAKKSDDVKVLDKDGKDVTAEREGRIKKGDILEVNSKKLGKVKVAVGGDGEINGGDDKVLSVGGQAVHDSVTQGVNEINKTPTQQNNAVQHANNGGGIFGDAINNDLDLFGLNENPQEMFSQVEINNLVAAILNDVIGDVQDKEDKKKLQKAS